MNLGRNTFTEQIMLLLTRRVPIFYLNYLEGEIDLEELEKFIKREIRIVLTTETELYELDDFRDETVKRHVNYLFKSILPVFIPFEDRDELGNIIKETFEFFEEKEVNFEQGLLILTENIDDYNVLLKRIHDGREKLKRNLEKILSCFSVRAMMERLLNPEELFFNDTKSIEKILDEQRKRISESPITQIQARKIMIALETYINNRIKEVFTPA